MSCTPSARQRHILELLGARRSLTIQELVAELGVSAMTVHRDLNKMAGSGQLARTRGGVALPSRTNTYSGVSGLCAMCNRLVLARSAVIMQSESRGHLVACCPHCGLALFEHATQADLMLVTDFLYSQMVSAIQASFLVGSAVASCCKPGILAFLGRDDAERFQLGFGGEIMDLAQARHHLRHAMTVSQCSECERVDDLQG